MGKRFALIDGERRDPNATETLVTDRGSIAPVDAGDGSGERQGIRESEHE